jgi:hypothetical protein
VKPRLRRLGLADEQLEGIDSLTDTSERYLLTLEAEAPDPPHGRPLRVVRLVLDHDRATASASSR